MKELRKLLDTFKCKDVSLTVSFRDEDGAENDSGAMLSALAVVEPASAREGELDPVPERPRRTRRTRAQMEEAAAAPEPAPEPAPVEYEDDWGAPTEERTERDYAMSDDHDWPDHLMPAKVDVTVLGALLGAHHKEQGNKEKTLDLMEDVTGTRKLREAHEHDFTALAGALLKDIARYRHGIKQKGD